MLGKCALYGSITEKRIIARNRNEVYDDAPGTGT
jgi:hypothetical protein